MITGLPGDWADWPLAATYIQWLNGFVVLGLPAMSAIESPGTPPPQPARATTETTAATTKKAQRARIDLVDFTSAADGSETMFVQSCGFSWPLVGRVAGV